MIQYIKGVFMKKNVLIGLVLILIGGIGIFLTTRKDTDGMIFKKDYESVNGKENANGKIHRVLDIPSDNPFVTVNVY